MTEHDWLAERFEEKRRHLRAVAYRMLGSRSEADDAVQEAWLRLSRAGAEGVENLGAWLTTVVGRVCLDMLRARKARREDMVGVHLPDPVAGVPDGSDPERDAVLADSVGLALLVVLERLAPAERVAFVLHDLFAMPFDEIAPIVGRSTMATRQLASRGRRRVQDADAAGERAFVRRREVIEAFLTAARGGGLDGLLAVLDPEVVVRADAEAIAAGAQPEVRGIDAVTRTFAGRARGARRALIDGVAGLVWAPGGRPRVVFAFTIAQEQIVRIDLLADPARLSRMELVILEDEPPAAG